MLAGRVEEDWPPLHTRQHLQRYPPLLRLFAQHVCVSLAGTESSGAPQSGPAKTFGVPWLFFLFPLRTRHAAGRLAAAHEKKKTSAQKECPPRPAHTSP